MVVAAGEELYRLVEQYAALGDHRTGTPVDAATIDWFAAELRAIGATVTPSPYEFPRYDTRWRLRVDGQEIPSLPVFYEGTGRVQAADPAVAALDVGPAGSLDGLGVPVEAARRAGRPALVLATITPTGRLVAANRAPGAYSGLPVVCVAGAVAEQLATATVELDLEARVVPGRSANVVGRLGPAGAPDPVVVTTPLSGWFRCAGERGTGIAIALSLARQLAETRPVTVLGTTGHELGFVGLRRHLERATDRPAAVIHLGASAAARGEDGALNRSVQVVAAAPGLDPEAAAAMAPAAHAYRGLAAAPSTFSGWRGEAALWAPYDVPLLSVSGASPYFHTPDDLPAASTTPALLDTMATALTGLALATVRGSGAASGGTRPCGPGR